ncbi:uncharacterized protein LOC113359206 [Papaver somniferum]|uniref:uncharacterized protein LOC113359206 n=1 Tax=Papaver somniferum TaxID=3469 RepID=UPI000E700BA0|nr:uncharacterized protein LOC113359206 [Papaver somniferum]
MDIINSNLPEDISNKIRNIHLFKDKNHILKKDQLRWTLTKSGYYTVKSLYDKLNENATDIVSLDLPKYFWTAIWKLYMSQRIKLFLWKCLQNALSTNFKLYGKVRDVELQCTMCGTATETTEHLLLHCPYATEVCKLAPNPISLNIDSSSTLLTLCKDWINNPRREISLEIMLTKMWFIWKERCNKVFEKKSTSAKSSRNSRTYFFLVKQKDFAGYAIILRDNAGNLGGGKAGQSTSSNPQEVEAIGVLQAATWAQENGLENFSIEGDCESLFKYMYGKNSDISWRSKAYLDEVKRLAQLCNNFLGFYFVPRQGNRAANILAKFVRPLNSSIL